MTELKPYTSSFTSGVINFGCDGEKKVVSAKNIYVSLDGTLHPHKFPKQGIWHFDGQVFYLPKPAVERIEEATE